MTTARRIPFACGIVLCLAFLAGCRNTNAELLEAELRHREIQYREALDELCKSNAHTDALQRELWFLRSKGPVLSPEVAGQTFTLRKITLGRLTGGYDNDKHPGDEGLQLFLEPKDEADHVLKSPGALHVTALNISPEGIKTPFSQWELSPEELRRNWKDGFMSKGYVLTLPWQGWPTQENVRVVAQLKLADGRMFEADRDVRVHLPPGVHGHAPEFPMLPPARPLLEEAPPPNPLPAEGPVLGPAVWKPVPLRNAVSLRVPIPIR